MDEARSLESRCEPKPTTSPSQCPWALPPTPLTSCCLVFPDTRGPTDQDATPTVATPFLGTLMKSGALTPEVPGASHLHPSTRL